MDQLVRARHWPWILVALWLLHSVGQAQEVTKDGAATAFLDDARKYVIESTKDRAKLKLSEKSLLNWTNPTRQQERGAIYVWTHEERPLAIGSFFTYEYNNKVYLKHEFHSLSAGALNASFDGTMAWTPKEAGIKWQDFVDSPAPRDTHGNRSLQMRQLARPFHTELIDPKGERNELRLAPRPLLEYASPKAGVIDGAIFSFVVATDPEVLLLIEAFEEIRDAKRGTGFRYAFARFHYWTVAAYDGDRKVWEALLDKAHEQNNLGDRTNISKIYNSFHPRRGEGK